MPRPEASPLPAGQPRRNLKLHQALAQDERTLNVGGLVFKHYANKVGVTRAPTFSGQWSTAQQDGRKRFGLASAYARTVCADPVLRARYETLAAQRGITIRSATISAFLQGKTHEMETPSPRANFRALRQTKPVPWSSTPEI